MNQYVKNVVKVALFPVVLMSFAAQAHEAGDFIFRAGLAQVTPDSSSSLVLGVADSGVEVENNVQIGLTGTYMFTDNIGFEVLASTPFDHDIKATGSIAGFGKLGSAKHLPPTFSVQYYFGDKDSTIRPYVGLGVNYTTFFSEDTTQNLNDAVAAVTGLTVSSTKMELDDSFGVAYEVGVDVEINKDWMFNASIWKIDIETTADINVNDGVANALVDVTIDPTVIMLGVAYTF